MATEKENILAGRLYDTSDPHLVAERLRARHLLQSFNDSPPTARESRHLMLTELLG